MLQYTQTVNPAEGPALTSGREESADAPKSTPIDVVIVENDADQLRLMTRILQRAGFSVATALDARLGWKLLEKQHSKVILCDYELPDGNGVEFCDKVRKDPNLSVTYFLLKSACRRCSLATEALNAGADDYLPIPLEHSEMIARIRVGVRLWTMHDRLRRAAVTDGLTGLYNHDYFIRLLETEIARSQRYGRPVALIIIDIDYFKAINDTYGHLVGNSTLEAFAQLLRKSFRDADFIGRLGGEEFVVLLPESTMADAVQAAHRVRLAVMESLEAPGIREHMLTASFGVADSDDPRVRHGADLLDLADRALYLAKRRGRNQVRRAYELDEIDEWADAIRIDEVEALRRKVASLSLQAKDVYVQSVAALLQTLDEKDPYTARHAVNVGFYAQQIAERMKCSQATIKSVYNAALLHDIGKVGMPDRILMKTTPLSSVERRVLEQVPIIGTRIVDHLRILESEVQIIRHQREYYDGSGLPCGLVGNQIPIGSRILLGADAFDAMTTNRIYRERREISDVMAEMAQKSGTQFDPDVVRAIQGCLTTYRELWQQRIQETLRVLPSRSGARVGAFSDPC